MTTVGVEPADLPVRLAVVRRLILERCADSFGARRAAVLLQRLERRLTRPPRVVVLGEANSGKSTLANLLLGFDMLTTDLVRNTHVPLRLAHAHAPAVIVHREDGETERLEPGDGICGKARGARLIEVGLPIERLARLEIVDTPGLEPATLDAAARVCRSAHAAVWCTLATQAWRASEAALWAAAGRRFGNRAILAVTQAGLLDDNDRAKVRARLEREVGGQFRAIVMVAEDCRSLAARRDGGATEEPAIVAATLALADDIQRARARQTSAVVHRFAEHMVADSEPAFGGEPRTMPVPAAVPPAMPVPVSMPARPAALMHAAPVRGEGLAALAAAS